MGEKNRYQRIFFIFSQEDPGFGTGQEPSGYAKIEVLDGKGKLSVQAQNLKEDPNRLEYKVYLLKCDDRQVSPAYAGLLPLKKNRGELLWVFDPQNVGNTGKRIEDFNVAAVVVEYKDRKNSVILCPLVGYKSGKVLWRDRLKGALNSETQRTFEPEPAVRKAEPKKDLYSKYTGGLESVYTPSPDKQSKNTPVHEEPAEMRPKFAGKTAEELLKTVEEIQQQAFPDQPEEEKPIAEGVEINMESNQREEFAESMGEQRTQIPVSSAGMPDIQKPVEYTEYREYEKYLERNLTANPAGPVYQGGVPGMTGIPGMSGMPSVPGMTGVQGVPGMPGIVPDCGILNSTGGQPSAACANCQLSCSKREELPESRGISDLERFKKELDQYFEIYNPFPTRRRDYKWWKVGSPVHLNNLLYSCNIKTPLLFNPKVMMAHFKYRYIIIGIYTDRVRRKEYIACGVPGVYGVDDRAFGDACRWVQVEGTRPKYGAFGYWLVYIDPKSGKLIGAN